MGSRPHKHRWQFLPRRATRIAFGLAAAVFSALALFTSGAGDARNFASLAAREQLSSQRQPHPLDPRLGKLVTKASEDIRPGDVVLAREEHGTKLAPRRVTQVFCRTTDHLRILEIAAATGARQTLKTTDEHPFWVAGRGWLPAGDLEPGAVLTSAAGAPVTLVATEREPHPAGITVYNFEVDGYHTYYVSCSASGSQSLLVHNSCKRRLDEGSRAGELRHAIFHSFPRKRNVPCMVCARSQCQTSATKSHRSIDRMAQGRPPESLTL